MPKPSALLQERFWWRALTTEFALPRHKSHFQMLCAGSARPFSKKRTLWLGEVDRFSAFLAAAPWDAGQTNVAERQADAARAVELLREAAVAPPGRPEGFLSRLFAKNGGHGGLYSRIAYFAVKYCFLNAAIVRKVAPQRYAVLAHWISDLLDEVLDEPGAIEWERSDDQMSAIPMADWFLGFCEREAFDGSRALPAQLRILLMPARQMANALFDEPIVNELVTSAARWAAARDAFAASLYFLRHGERRITRQRREADAATKNSDECRGAVRIAVNRKTKERRP